MSPPATGFISAMIDMYDASYTHVRPSSYGFDIYGDQAGIQAGDTSSIDHQLQWITTELTTKGEGQKPVFLQETYFNSETMRTLIKKAHDQNGLKVQYVFQWPFQFGTVSASNNVNDLSPFNYYLP